MIVSGEFWTVGGIQRRHLARISDPSITAGAPPAPRLAPGVSLAPLAPNPMRSRTRVRFTLPGACTARVDVLDAQGRRVARVLAPEALRAGTHDVEWRADGLAPGRYLVRLETPWGSSTRRLVRLAP